MEVIASDIEHPQVVIDEGSGAVVVAGIVRRVAYAKVAERLHVTGVAHGAGTNQGTPVVVQDVALVASSSTASSSLLSSSSSSAQVTVCSTPHTRVMPAAMASDSSSSNEDPPWVAAQCAAAMMARRTEQQPQAPLLLAIKATPPSWTSTVPTTAATFSSTTTSDNHAADTPHGRLSSVAAIVGLDQTLYCLHTRRPLPITDPSARITADPGPMVNLQWYFEGPCPAAPPCLPLDDNDSGSNTTANKDSHPNHTIHSNPRSGGGDDDDNDCCLDRLLIVQFRRGTALVVLEGDVERKDEDTEGASASTSVGQRWTAARVVWFVFGSFNTASVCPIDGHLALAHTTATAPPLPPQSGTASNRRSSVFHQSPPSEPIYVFANLRMPLSTHVIRGGGTAAAPAATAASTSAGSGTAQEYPSGGGDDDDLLLPRCGLRTARFELSPTAAVIAYDSGSSNDCGSRSGSASPQRLLRCVAWRRTSTCALLTVGLWHRLPSTPPVGADGSHSHQAKGSNSHWDVHVDVYVLTSPTVADACLRNVLLTASSSNNSSTATATTTGIADRPALSSVVVVEMRKVATLPLWADRRLVGPAPPPEEDTNNASSNNTSCVMRRSDTSRNTRNGNRNGSSSSSSSVVLVLPHSGRTHDTAGDHLRVLEVTAGGQLHLWSSPFADNTVVTSYHHHSSSSSSAPSGSSNNLSTVTTNTNASSSTQYSSGSNGSNSYHSRCSSSATGMASHAFVPHPTALTAFVGAYGAIVDVIALPHGGHGRRPADIFGGRSAASVGMVGGSTCTGGGTGGTAMTMVADSANDGSGFDDLSGSFFSQYAAALALLGQSAVAEAAAGDLAARHATALDRCAALAQHYVRLVVRTAGGTVALVSVATGGGRWRTVPATVECFFSLQPPPPPPSSPQWAVRGIARAWQLSAPSIVTTTSNSPLPMAALSVLQPRVPDVEPLPLVGVLYTTAGATTRVTSSSNSAASIVHSIRSSSSNSSACAASVLLYHCAEGDALVPLLSVPMVPFTTASNSNSGSGDHDEGPYLTAMPQPLVVGAPLSSWSQQQQQQGVNPPPSSTFSAAAPVVLAAPAPTVTADDIVAFMRQHDPSKERMVPALLKACGHDAGKLLRQLHLKHQLPPPPEPTSVQPTTTSTTATGTTSTTGTALSASATLRGDVTAAPSRGEMSVVLQWGRPCASRAHTAEEQASSPQPAALPTPASVTITRSRADSDRLLVVVWDASGRPWGASAVVCSAASCHILEPFLSSAVVSVKQQQQHQQLGGSSPHPRAAPPALSLASQLSLAQAGVFPPMPALYASSPIPTLAEVRTEWLAAWASPSTGPAASAATTRVAWGLALSRCHRSGTDAYVPTCWYDNNSSRCNRGEGRGDDNKDNNSSCKESAREGVFVPTATCHIPAAADSTDSTNSSAGSGASVGATTATLFVAGGTAMTTTPLTATTTTTSTTTTAAMCRWFVVLSTDSSTPTLTKDGDHSGHINGSPTATSVLLEGHAFVRKATPLTPSASSCNTSHHDSLVVRRSGIVTTVVVHVQDQLFVYHCDPASALLTGQPAGAAGPQGEGAMSPMGALTGTPPAPRAETTSTPTSTSSSSSSAFVLLLVQAHVRLVTPLSDVEAAWATALTASSTAATASASRNHQRGETLSYRSALDAAAADRNTLLVVVTMPEGEGEEKQGSTNMKATTSSVNTIFKQQQQQQQQRQTAGEVSFLLHLPALIQQGLLSSSSNAVDSHTALKTNGNSIFGNSTLPPSVVRWAGIGAVPEPPAAPGGGAQMIGSNNNVNSINARYFSSSTANSSITSSAVPPLSSCPPSDARSHHPRLMLTGLAVLGAAAVGGHHRRVGGRFSPLVLVSFIDTASLSLFPAAEAAPAVDEEGSDSDQEEEGNASEEDDDYYEEYEEEEEEGIRYEEAPQPRTLLSSSLLCWGPSGSLLPPRTIAASPDDPVPPPTAASGIIGSGGHTVTELRSDLLRMFLDCEWPTLVRCLSHLVAAHQSTTAAETETETVSGDITKATGNTAAPVVAVQDLPAALSELFDNPLPIPTEVTPASAAELLRVHDELGAAMGGSASGGGSSSGCLDLTRAVSVVLPSSAAVPLGPVLLAAECGVTSAMVSACTNTDTDSACYGIDASGAVVALPVPSVDDNAAGGEHRKRDEGHSGDSEDDKGKEADSGPSPGASALLSLPEVPPAGTALSLEAAAYLEALCAAAGEALTAGTVLGLQPGEQMQSLAAVETLRSLLGRRLGGMDTAACRLLAHLRMRDVARRLRQPPRPIPPAAFGWAAVSDAQEQMLTAAAVTDWPSCAAAGVPLWTRSLITLRGVAETIAKGQFARRDVRECALMYVLADRLPTLASLCKAVNNERLQSFYLRDFTQRRNRKAAAANAYAAIGKGALTFGCAFFVLSGDILSAAAVALQRTGDAMLGLMIVRLASKDDPVLLRRFRRLLAQSPAPPSEWELFGLHFRAGDYERGLKQLVSGSGGGLSTPLPSTSATSATSATASVSMCAPNEVTVFAEHCLSSVAVYARRGPMRLFPLQSRCRALLVAARAFRQRGLVSAAAKQYARLVPLLEALKAACVDGSAVQLLRDASDEAKRRRLQAETAAAGAAATGIHADFNTGMIAMAFDSDDDGEAAAPVLAQSGPASPPPLPQAPLGSEEESPSTPRSSTDGDSSGSSDDSDDSDDSDSSSSSGSGLAGPTEDPDSDDDGIVDDALWPAVARWFESINEAIPALTHEARAFLTETGRCSAAAMRQATTATHSIQGGRGDGEESFATEASTTFALASSSSSSRQMGHLLASLQLLTGRPSTAAADIPVLRSLLLEIAAAAPRCTDAALLAVANCCLLHALSIAAAATENAPLAAALAAVPVPLEEPTIATNNTTTINNFDTAVAAPQNTHIGRYLRALAAAVRVVRAEGLAGLRAVAGVVATPAGVSAVVTAGGSHTSTIVHALLPKVPSAAPLLQAPQRSALFVLLRLHCGQCIRTAFGLGLVPPTTAVAAHLLATVSRDLRAHALCFLRPRTYTDGAGGAVDKHTDSGVFVSDASPRQAALLLGRVPLVDEIPAFEALHRAQTATVDLLAALLAAQVAADGRCAPTAAQKISEATTSTITADANALPLLLPVVAGVAAQVCAGAMMAAVSLPPTTVWPLVGQGAASASSTVATLRRGAGASRPLVLLLAAMRCLQGQADGGTTNTSPNAGPDFTPEIARVLQGLAQLLPSTAASPPPPSSSSQYKDVAVLPDPRLRHCADGLLTSSCVLEDVSWWWSVSRHTPRHQRASAVALAVSCGAVGDTTAAPVLSCDPRSAGVDARRRIAAAGVAAGRAGDRNHSSPTTTTIGAQHRSSGLFRERAQLAADPHGATAVCCDQSNYDNVAMANAYGITVMHGLREHLLPDNAEAVRVLQPRRETAMVRFAASMAATTAAGEACGAGGYGCGGVRFGSPLPQSSPTANGAPSFLAAPSLATHSRDGDHHAASMRGTMLLQSHPLLPLYVACGSSGCCNLMQFGSDERLSFFQDVSCGALSALRFAPQGEGIAMAAASGGAVALWRFGAVPAPLRVLSQVFRGAGGDLCFLQGRGTVVAAIGSDTVAEHHSRRSGFSSVLGGGSSSRHASAASSSSGGGDALVVADFSLPRRDGQVFRCAVPSDVGPSAFVLHDPQRAPTAMTVVGRGGRMAIFDLRTATFRPEILAMDLSTHALYTRSTGGTGGGGPTPSTSHSNSSSNHNGNTLTCAVLAPADQLVAFGTQHGEVLLLDPAPILGGARASAAGGGGSGKFVVVPVVPATVTYPPHGYHHPPAPVVDIVATPSSLIYATSEGKVHCGALISRDTHNFF